jgi:hypothetical protein
VNCIFASVLSAFETIRVSDARIIAPSIFVLNPSNFYYWFASSLFFKFDKHIFVKTGQFGFIASARLWQSRRTPYWEGGHPRCQCGVTFLDVDVRLPSKDGFWVRQGLAFLPEPDFATALMASKTFWTSFRRFVITCLPRQ